MKLVSGCDLIGQLKTLAQLQSECRFFLFRRYSFAFSMTDSLTKNAAVLFSYCIKDSLLSRICLGLHHHRHCPLRQKAHKAVTLPVQPSLRCVAVLAILELVRTALSCSLSTVLLQVVFGLPFAFRPCGLHLSTFMCSRSHYLSQFIGLVS